MTTQTSQVPAKTNSKQDIMSLLDSEHVKQQVARAIPKHMKADRMLRVMTTTLNRTPKLQQCTKQSLLSALMICTQAGLEPDGRHAHLIPFGDQVQVIFDYKGLIAIAERNGVKNIRAQAVCENDVFEFSIENGATKVKHVINYLMPRGLDVAYYSVCERDGQCDYEVMTLDEIESIRKRSKAANSGPWVTDPGEMRKKTVLRRHSKRWPMLAEVAEVFYADDDTPGDKFTPKPPEFAKPVRSSSMDFLEAPAGTLTGAPMAVEGYKDLEDAGLGPESSAYPLHDEFQAWMDANGILYSQLQEAAIADPTLYPGADTYPSLRDMSRGVIKDLLARKLTILTVVKGVKK